MTNLVMLVKDRYHLTKQALDSLYAHTPHDQFNLTIVDDESEDFRISRMESKGNASVVRVRNSGHVLSQLKNLGVAWSEQRFGRGDWLCICDNDVYFMDGWLENIEGTAGLTEEEGFVLWGGQSHPFHKPIGQRSIVSEHDCLAGTHWFMRWETWDKYGPFNRTTAPGVCQSEDFAFTQRLRAADGRIGVTVPHCVVDTGIHQTGGKPSPGADIKLANRIPGVIYE